MIAIYDLKTAESLELDELYSKLSTLVCEEGPQLLTLGMSQLEANRSILACLELLLSRARTAERMSKEAHEFKSETLREVQRLNNRLALADRIIDALPTQSYRGDAELLRCRDKFEDDGC